MPGRKPTVTALKLITGRPGKLGINENEPQPTGKPVKPRRLKGMASEIWDEHIEIAYWLTAADSLVFANWCRLAAEIEKGIGKVTASRISQWRTLGSQLGFDPSSRARINVGKALKNKKAEDPADKFFG